MGRTTKRLPGAMEFGKRVRARRTELGMSQMALAEATGMHFTHVSSVERGERNVGLENILRLAEGLGVDPGALVGGLMAERS
ncbi:MAG TPA: helix-turn-helix transcriptional regulator [Acidimicrobiales bacterium]|nr:helix-turn-helix transcriptional regulator [Acidimicrobiales bacterium]